MWLDAVGPFCQVGSQNGAAASNESTGLARWTRPCDAMRCSCPSYSCKALYSAVEGLCSGKDMAGSRWTCVAFTSTLTRPPKSLTLSPMSRGKFAQIMHTLTCNTKDRRWEVSPVNVTINAPSSPKYLTVARFYTLALFCTIVSDYWALFHLRYRFTCSSCHLQLFDPMGSSKVQ